LLPLLWLGMLLLLSLLLVLVLLFTKGAPETCLINFDQYSESSTVSIPM
jgi:hypothetical protein